MSESAATPHRPPAKPNEAFMISASATEAFVRLGHLLANRGFPA